MIFDCKKPSKRTVKNDRHGLNDVVVFLRGETLFFQREEMFGKNGNIFNLWIRTVFCGRLFCFESFSAIEDGCNTIGVLLTVGIIMILDVKRV